MLGLHLKFGSWLHSVAHAVGGALRRDAQVVAHGLHAVQHGASVLGGAIGGAERFAAHEVRALASGVASAEHHLVDGVEHGYRWVKTEVKGAGQVIGSAAHWVGGVAHRIGDDVSAVWSWGEGLGRGVEHMTQYLPIIVGGGALLYVARTTG